jgi:hypothetical protein
MAINSSLKVHGLSYSLYKSEAAISIKTGATDQIELWRPITAEVLQIMS